MPTLDIHFNCLCLFVRDEAGKVVHVLMPSTSGHEGHEGHQHVVRMLHPSFSGEAKRTGQPMEGWALEFGPPNGAADTSLKPAADVPSTGELPDLSKLTNGTVDPSLVGSDPGGAVSARVTLRAGRVLRMASEAVWQLDGETLTLAHRVVWRMPLEEAPMSWVRLIGDQHGNPKPLQALTDLEPEGDGSYVIKIYHVTADALPPHGATLSPAEVREHFRAFYGLLSGVTKDPPPLPQIISRGINTVNCVGGAATKHG